MTEIIEWNQNAAFLWGLPLNMCPPKEHRGCTDTKAPGSDPVCWDCRVAAFSPVGLEALTAVLPHSCRDGFFVSHNHRARELKQGGKGRGEALSPLVHLCESVFYLMNYHCFFFF